MALSEADAADLQALYTSTVGAARAQVWSRIKEARTGGLPLSYEDIVAIATAAAMQAVMHERLRIENAIEDAALDTLRKAVEP
jgi:hypothetical protein